MRQVTLNALLITLQLVMLYKLLPAFGGNVVLSKIAKVMLVQVRQGLRRFKVGDNRQVFLFVVPDVVPK